MKNIQYHKQALKDLTSIPANFQKRIREKIQQYAENPQALANQVIKMQNEVGYRLRVGDWRVRFDEDDVVIEIFRVLPRGEVYKKKR